MDTRTHFIWFSVIVFTLCTACTGDSEWPDGGEPHIDACGDVIDDGGYNLHSHDPPQIEVQPAMIELRQGGVDTAGVDIINVGLGCLEIEDIRLVQTEGTEFEEGPQWPAADVVLRTDESIYVDVTHFPSDVDRDEAVVEMTTNDPRLPSGIVEIPVIAAY